MKRCRMKSIRLKFALIFIGILLVSCFVAFFITLSATNNYFKSCFRSYIDEVLSSANTVTMKSGMDAEQIAEALSNQYYTISVKSQEELTGYNLKPAQVTKLHMGKEVTYNDRNKTISIIAVQSEPGKFFVFTFSVVGSAVDRFRQLTMSSLFLCAVIGTILMTGAVSIVTKPIKRLTEGAKKVAAGDFSVRIENHRADEIGTLVENFNTMTEQLGNIEYLRKDFVSNVSHEFKNPIASILGFTKLMKNPELDRAQRMNYLDIIEEEASRLSHLSANLLNLSRIESNSLSRQTAAFSLDEQLRKAILLFTDKWETKNIALDLQLDKASYLGDEELIQQIWINLLDNAIKFSGDNSTVTVLLRDTPDAAVVTIADEGIGIPKEKLNKIFEKFYQADDSHATKGSGLGLSIVKSILTLIGGRVKVESEEGAGTTFAVTLPHNAPNQAVQSK